MSRTVAGIRIPDSKLAQDAENLVREHEDDMLFNHSVRTYLFAALAGQRLKLKYDEELLYTSALFHDLGLTETFKSETERFEVDGANAAKSFLIHD
jgi:HD superfamily phosphodiesterase